MPEVWNQRKFDIALAECIRTSRRTCAAVINGHALRIAFTAQKETPKADKEKIALDLQNYIYDTNRKGKRKLRVSARRKFMGLAAAPVVALMINKKRGEQGKPGLYGAEMANAIRKYISSRQRSAAFLKSGWSPAIKRLLQIVPYGMRGPNVRPDNSVKQYGAAKGEVRPAVEDERPTCVIENLVGITGPNSSKHNAALMEYGRPALEKAFEKETANMMEHLKQKLGEESFAEFNRANQL